MPTKGDLRDHWMHFLVAATICFNVSVGGVAMAYMSFTGTAIPDQYDRFVTLLAGGLLGFLVRGAVDQYPRNVVVQEPLKVEEIG